MASPTITINPTDGGTVYADQILLIKATISASNPLTDKHIAFTDKSSGGQITFIYPAKEASAGGSTSGPIHISIDIDAHDNTKGTATVYAFINQDASGPVKLNAKSDVTGTTADATYTVSTSQVVAQPSAAPVPCLKTTLQANLNPSQAGDNTAVYAIQFTDSASNAPVQNYLVGLQTDNDDLLRKVNFFASASSTTPLDVVPFGPDQAAGGVQTIFTTTDNNGVATFIGVPGSEAVGGDLSFQYVAHKSVVAGLASLVVYPAESDFNLKEPSPQDTELDLIPGPDVPVSIPAEGLEAGDQIYLIFNGQYVDYFEVERRNESKVMHFPKALAKTDGTADNDLFYAKFVKSNDSVRHSKEATFACTGTTGNLPPDYYDDLDPPIAPWGGRINSNTVEGSTLPIHVFVNQEELDPPFQLQHGDSISGTVFLDGYKSPTDKEIYGQAKAGPQTVQPGDVTRGYAILAFDCGKFQGYDSRRDPPRNSGTATFVYSVKRGSTTRYSNQLRVLLDTVG